LRKKQTLPKIAAAARQQWENYQKS